VTTNDNAQRYEGKWMEFAQWKESKQKGLNSEKGTEKKSIVRKRELAWKVEGIVNRKQA